MRDESLPYKTLGKAVRALRIGLGFTQRKMAETLGFRGGESHVSNVERGAYGLEGAKALHLLKLATELDTADCSAGYTDALIAALAGDRGEAGLLCKALLIVPEARAQILGSILAEA